MRISIVIPSRNRCAPLLRSVERLRAIIGDDPGAEIVVVLNGCVDQSAQALASMAGTGGLQVLDLPAGNAASARNAGARIARGDVLIFLDDDMDVGPHFLSAHEAAHAGRPDQVVLGYAEPSIDGLGWYDQGKRAWWNDHYSELAQAGRRFDYRDLLSGNVSIGRELFLAVGGFDETLDCREDYELGYRLQQRKVQFVFAPLAQSLHRDARRHAEAFDRAMREGRADVQLAAKHPGLSALARRRPASPKFGAARRLLGEPRLWAALAGALGLCERLRLRAAWLRVDHAARTYAYARGQRLAGEGALSPAAATRYASPAVYDLSEGYDAVQARLDGERPDAAEVRFGWREVFSVPAEPGAEPLAGRHLPRLLEQHLDALVRAEAASRLAPMLTEPALGRSGTAAVAVGELNLADPHPAAQPVCANRPFRWLVHRGERPLGWIRSQPSLGRPVDLRELVADQLGDALVRDEVARRLEAPSDAPCPPISVVICTRDRLGTLKRCLAAVAALDYPKFEIVVVDNAPSNDDTERHVRGLKGVRYVREPTPGLDWARNRGAAAARYDIIAYTDDDTRVDALWLRGLARAFRQPEVDVVTGLVAPMTLDTPAQLYFEDVYGGMGKGMSPRWFRGRELSPAGKLWASACGVGANMAVRRRAFAKVGTFDTALDVGTATRGGGDIEFFHRVLAAEGTLVYEPTALVWHEHRQDFPRLQAQLRDNGSGFACYLLTCAARRSVSPAAVLRFALWNWGARWLLRNLLKPGRHSRRLVVAELYGAVLGLRRYGLARREAARLAQAVPEPMSTEVAHAG